MASSGQVGTSPTAGNAPTVNGSKSSHKEQSGPASNPKPKPVDAKKPGKQPPADINDGKPTGAELKKKAKDGKAARRAKEKQEKQGTTQATAPADAPTQEQYVPNAPVPVQKSATSAQKQHQRTGSAAGNAPKQMPIRHAEPQAVAPTAPSKERTKRVALFSHLYSGPRRTTIAGAGKDVHPAVLSLGIQISNYTIIGSNARCVAMLLAFKKVISFKAIMAPTECGSR